MMKSLFTTFALAALAFTPATLPAQQPFVHRPHTIHERQLIPDRRSNYETYYLRKYGRLPPFAPVYVAPAEPVLPPGMRWSNTWVPGYGYVPVDPVPPR
jgi:hypothetical protein